MTEGPVLYEVWVPPGGSLLVSPGVKVLTMQEAVAGSAAERMIPTPARESMSGVFRALRRGPAEVVQRGSALLTSAGQYLPPRHAEVPRDQNRASGGGPGTDADSELLYVTPELLVTASAVMDRYEMSVSGMTFITAKPDKGGAIWRIETDRGPRSLKQLHRTVPRSRFSVGAQEYVVGRGARVPAIVRTRDEAPGVEQDGKLWIVTDWVEPLTPATKVDLTGAAALCYGLGEFHQHSRGYLMPEGAQKASRLFRWPKTYQKIITKIDWFRHLARAYPEMAAAPVILAVVDEFEQQAKSALQRLEASAYTALTARGEPYWGLAHQDERSQRQKQTPPTG